MSEYAKHPGRGKSDDDRRPIRRSKLISSAGPGSVVRIGRESFAICDSSLWNLDDQARPDRRLEIRLLRLSDMLAVSALYAPPTEPLELEAQRRQGHKSRDWWTRIPVYRFPRWLLCSDRDCSRLWYWGMLEENRLGPGQWNGENAWLHRWGAADRDDPAPNCPSCAARGKDQWLQPYPYVLACSRGHLSDLKLGELVHKYGQVPDGAPACEFESTPELKYLRGSAAARFGRRGPIIECEQCGRWIEESAILDRADPMRLKALNRDRKHPLDAIKIKCGKKQPWMRDRVEDCPLNTQFWLDDKQRAEIVPLRHAGEKIYHPVAASAIDIPPDAFLRELSDGGSDGLEGETKFVELVEGLRLNRTEWTESVAGQRLLRDLRRATRLSEEEILARATEHLRDAESATHAQVEGDLDQALRAGEFQAFIDAEQPPDPSFARFIVEKLPHSPDDFGSVDPLHFVSDIRLVHKLRLVRALRGFTRLGGPSGEDGEAELITPPHLHHNCDWLPAVESIGEGIFLAFSEARLAAWEAECATFIEGRLNGILTPTADPDEEPWQQKVDPPRLPRFVFLHTFSHLLMRQLAFESGYAASSLGEVIYASTSDRGRMAGVLIYTMEGDEKGGMGGLVRLGRPAELRKLMTNAIMRADWCSNDPICSSRERQGPRRLNRAACHACALVNEASCSHKNDYLDRMLLVDRRSGVFRDVLASLDERAETA